jgi:hypothetical protein
MKKEKPLTDIPVAVRLTSKEVEGLDIHTQVLSRSQLIRVLVQHFLAMPKDEQRKFLFGQVFGSEEGKP